MEHPIALKPKATVASMHDAIRSGTISNDEAFVEGAYLSWDDDLADITLTLNSGPGQIFDLEASVAGGPRWFSFNIGLGAGAFAPGSILGIVLDHQGTVPGALNFFIRTARDGELKDTNLSDYGAMSEKRGVVSIQHVVTHEDAMCKDGGFHTLVVSLPAQNFRWTVYDMNVFVLPSKDG